MPYSNASCALMPPSYDIVNKFAIRVREDTILKYLVVAGVAAVSLAIACIGCMVAYCRLKRQHQTVEQDNDQHDDTQQQPQQMLSVVDDEEQQQHSLPNSTSDIPLTQQYISDDDDADIPGVFKK